MPTDLENWAMTTGLENISFIPIPMLARLCSKSFKLGFSSMWTENFQMFKLDLEKTEEPEIKLAAFVGSWRKQRHFRKTSTSSSLTTLKPLTVWITRNSGKFLKSWEYQTILPVSWETCMQVKKQQLEPDVKQAAAAAAAAKLLQSCPTLCDPMDSSPAGSSGHGIL